MTCPSPIPQNKAQSLPGLPNTHPSHRHTSSIPSISSSLQPGSHPMTLHLPLIHPQNQARTSYHRKKNLLRNNTQPRIHQSSPPYKNLVLPALSQNSPRSTNFLWSIQYNTIQSTYNHNFLLIKQFNHFFSERTIPRYQTQHIFKKWLNAVPALLSILALLPLVV